jgi:hypothetical protein
MAWILNGEATQVDLQQVMMTQLLQRRKQTLAQRQQRSVTAILQRHVVCAQGLAPIMLMFIGLDS